MFHRVFTQLTPYLNDPASHNDAEQTCLKAKNTQWHLLPVARGHAAAQHLMKLHYRL